MPAGSPEITDLIIDFDPRTLERLPVAKQAALDRLREAKNFQAARLVERFPADDGILRTGPVDAALLRTHYELQRLSEEFQHGWRMANFLKLVLRMLRAEGVPPPYRLVDIGCGIGFVLRWLAALGNLGEDVELVGADYNSLLLEEARRLAEIEQLNVRFLTANAFRLEQPATIFFSTGVLHHFRGESLVDFFRSHESSPALLFAHFDFQPSLMAPLGAWLFHYLRFREPIARHDGVLSAIRAHDATTLTQAARTGAPGFAATTYHSCLGWIPGIPIPRPFHILLGIRPELRNSLLDHLGSNAWNMGEWA